MWKPKAHETTMSFIVNIIYNPCCCVYAAIIALSCLAVPAPGCFSLLSQSREQFFYYYMSSGGTLQNRVDLTNEKLFYLLIYLFQFHFKPSCLQIFGLWTHLRLLWLCPSSPPLPRALPRVLWERESREPGREGQMESTQVCRTAEVSRVQVNVQRCSLSPPCVFSGPTFWERHEAQTAAWPSPAARERVFSLH